MKMKPWTLLVLAALVISSCEIIQFNTVEPVGTVEGVRPVYTDANGWDDITATDPQPIENLGKIYYKDSYIYVNERNKGIHVIDNTDPANPLRIRFIQVIGSEDIAIKGNILYADNITDLVAIDISDLEAIKVTSRLKGLYSVDKKDYPEGYSGYFECVDPTKGIVIGWEDAILENPGCLR